MVRSTLFAVRAIGIFRSRSSQWKFIRDSPVWPTVEFRVVDAGGTESCTTIDQPSRVVILDTVDNGSHQANLDQEAAARRSLGWVHESDLITAREARSTAREPFDERNSQRSRHDLAALSERATE